MGLGSNDPGQGNDTVALRVAQSYTQPPTPSERCNNLRKTNRELREKLAETEAARDKAIDKIIELANAIQANQQPQGDHMAEEFKSGDVVKLKSGGPKMTVRNRTALPATNANAGLSSAQGWGVTPVYSFTSPVTCDWFIGGEYEKCGTFEAGSLRLVGDDAAAE